MEAAGNFEFGGYNAIGINCSDFVDAVLQSVQEILAEQDDGGAFRGGIEFFVNDDAVDPYTGEVFEVSGEPEFQVALTGRPLTGTAVDDGINAENKGFSAENERKNSRQHNRKQTAPTPEKEREKGRREWWARVVG